ncbi:integrase [Klebsiella pneumoniae]|nr:integrase [Klebsiella pneumoniae]
MMADINDSYYARNEKWIRPALIAFIFAFGNSLGDILGVRLENGIYGHSRFCNTDFDDKLACLNLSGV